MLTGNDLNLLAEIDDLGIKALISDKLEYDVYAPDQPL